MHACARVLSNARCVPAMARLRTRSAQAIRRELLPLAPQVRRRDVSDAKRLKALEIENGRLKRLLADALPEN